MYFKFLVTNEHWMNLLMYVIKHYVVHAVYFTRVADKGQIRLLPNFTQSFISTIKAQEPILKNRSSGKYPADEERGNSLDSELLVVLGP